MEDRYETNAAAIRAVGPGDVPTLLRGGDAALRLALVEAIAMAADTLAGSPALLPEFTRETGPAVTSLAVGLLGDTFPTSRQGLTEHLVESYSDRPESLDQLLALYDRAGVDGTDGLWKHIDLVGLCGHVGATGPDELRGRAHAFVPELVRCIDDPCWLVRSVAAGLMALLGPVERPSLPTTVRDLLKVAGGRLVPLAEEGWWRAEIAGQVGLIERIPTIAEAIEHDGEELRHAAASALAQLFPDGDLPELVVVPLDILDAFDPGEYLADTWAPHLREVAIGVAP